jgi:hypothetical protein
MPPKKIAKAAETRSAGIAFQIRPSLKAALQTAADAEQRSLSQLIAIRLEAAMKAEGYLK